MSHYDSENQATEPKKQHNEEAAVTNDAVFGTITEDGPNYRNVCSPYHLYSTTRTSTNMLRLAGSEHQSL
jgi:hypothetical protein